MNGVAFRDRAVYLPDADTLVVADVHLGRGESSDVVFPIAGNLTERLSALLSRYEPAHVVFAGDVLHQFTRVSEQVQSTFDTLCAACRTAGAQVSLVAGNHDTQLARCWNGPIHDAVRVTADAGARAADTDASSRAGDASERAGDASERAGDASERAGDTDASGRSAGAGTRPAAAVTPTGQHVPSFERPVIVRHGHERPPASEAREAGTYLIGHDHPTLEIEGKRRPCYLFAPDGPGGTDVVMLPAFNRLPAGVSVAGMSASDFQSPFVDSPDDCCPLVWDDDAGRTLSFPPLGEFRRLL